MAKARYLVSKYQLLTGIIVGSLSWGLILILLNQLLVDPVVLEVRKELSYLGTVLCLLKL